MWLLELKRWYWLWRIKKQGKTADNALRNCWKQTSFTKNHRCQDAEFLVVDTETSGLDPVTGELLSIGWVVICEGKVRLNSATHCLIKPKNTVGHSATIHQLRDCELDQGLTLEQVMFYFLAAAKDRVLVFHHAPLDMGFLNKVSRQVFGMPLLLPFVDTLQLEKNLLEKKSIPLGQSVLRLASCRARYNLPAYPAHNALVDALSTAELLIAQIAARGSNSRLSYMLHY